MFENFKNLHVQLNKFFSLILHDGYKFLKVLKHYKIIHAGIVL